MTGDDGREARSERTPAGHHWIEHVSDAVVALDRDGCCTYINRVAAELFGRQPHDLLGWPLIDQLPDVVVPPLRRALDDARHAGAAARFETYVGAWGRWIESRVVPTVDGAAIVFADVTARHRDEQTLRESETRLRLASDAAGHMQWEWEPLTGAIRYVGDAFLRRLGLVGDVAPRDASAWLARVHLEDRPRVDAMLADVVQRRRDELHIEYRFRRDDGSYAVLEDRGRVLRDPDGRPARAVGVIMDVTETRRLTEELRQAQKMEAVGQLAGGVAHDFNNVLTVVSGNARLALDQLEGLSAGAGPAVPAETALLRELLQEILGGADRAADLTRQLLAFARKQMLRPRSTNVNDVVARVVPLVRRLIGEDVRVEAHLHDALGTVLVDPGQLEQIVLNLAVNARDAMREAVEKRLTIITANVRVCRADDPGEVVPVATPIRREIAEALLAGAGDRRGLTPGLFAVLAVSDTGHGMDARTRQRVFEPFFTTKPTGVGTGLGLATVYGVVKQSGGNVYVDSAPGAGTAFTIYLPLEPGTLARDERSRDPTAETRAPAHRPPHLDAAAASTRRAVLVVEDDPALRQVIERIIRAEGFPVISASDGAEALAVWTARQGEIGAVITDAIMPDLGGLALILRLRGERPDLPVTLMSGYTDVIGRTEWAALGARWMPKPFTRVQVADVLRAMLPE